MIKKLLILTGVALAAVSLSSCATIAGIGQDVQSLGQGVQQSAAQ